VPTYGFLCAACGSRQDAFMSIREYVQHPPAFFCCGTQMQRHLDVIPGLAVGNALAGDRHYDGMRATDGTDISTRSKHRAYMKAHNLTTADDFSSTWKRAEQERTARVAGHDPSRVQDVARAVAKHSGG
jgi:predicted nucleic acid-binding Zn ribbon protein